MVGESECSSGFPMIPTSRVLPSMCIVFSRGCTRVRRSSGFLELLRPFKYPLEQRQKYVFDVLQLSRVTLNDIHITDVVNVVSHRVRRHAVFAVRPGEAHHVRLIGHAPESLDYAFHLFERRRLAAVHQHHVSQHAFGEYLPHEVEPLLAGRPVEVKNVPVRESDTTEVHRDSGVDLFCPLARLSFGRNHLYLAYGADEGGLSGVERSRHHYLEDSIQTIPPRRPTSFSGRQ